MWKAVAAFELRLQLRSPVFAVVAALTTLLVLGSATLPALQVGGVADGLRNGPEAVVRTHGVWSLFFAFTAVAFAGEAALRDNQTGFGPVLRATGVAPGAVYWGRFLGAFAVTAAAFVAVPLGLSLASFAPWAEPGTLGPLRPEAYLLGFFAVGLPNLFVLCAAMHALCWATRSLAGGWLGAVGLLITYGLGADGTTLPPLLEPFGFAALDHGGLGANRLLWTGLAAVALIAASGQGGEARAAGRQRPEVVDEPLPPRASSSAQPRHDARAQIIQLFARTRWEMRAVFGSAPFLVVTGLGALNAGAALWAAAGAGADTPALIAHLIDSFRLVPVVVALFYAGELVWAERDARTHDLLGATPAPDWAFLFPKLLALAGVLLALLLAGAAVSYGVDRLRGTPEADGAAWLRFYILPRSFDWLAFAVLAVFLQTVSPSKLTGWGWTVLFLVAQLTLERLGLNDGLYRYGGRLDGPLSDLLARDEARGTLLRLYWGAFALMLATMAYALHGRGDEPRWRGRLRQALRRLRGPVGAIAATATAAFVGAGAALARTPGG